MDGERERFPKRDRTARLLRVSSLLYQNRVRGISAKDIARRIDVNVRTVYRDLKALEDELRIAVWEENGLWRCEQGDFLPPLKLSLHEAVALFLSARMMARFADKKQPHVISAFGKLADVLPAPLARHVNATIAAMSDGQLDPGYVRVLETIATAWAESRKLRIRYARHEADGKPQPTWRTVAPRYLEPNPSGRGCYLIADDSRSGERRTFKLERIVEAQPTGDRFEPSVDPDALEQLSRAWLVSNEPPTCVRVRFHEAAAARRALENRWHPSQQDRTLDDGTLELTFDVAGVLEITPWILGWGDTVEVLEPPELRARLADVARRMNERYA